MPLMKNNLPFFSFTLEGEDASENFAQFIAPFFKKGDYLRLSGDLGSGKTSFMRFLVWALFCDQTIEVTSPTFSLVHIYENRNILRHKNNIANIIHADLYRLSQPEEVLELDLREGIENGLLCVEWAEKAGNFLPKPNIHIHFQYLPLEAKNFDEARCLTIFLDETTKRLWQKNWISFEQNSE